MPRDFVEATANKSTVKLRRHPHSPARNGQPMSKNVKTRRFQGSSASHGSKCRSDSGIEVRP